MSWRWEAWCAKEPEEIQDFFFSSEPEEVYHAQCICQGCPVIVDCLQFAFHIKETNGIWGMHTPKDRRRLARNMKQHGSEALSESFSIIERRINYILENRIS